MIDPVANSFSSSESSRLPTQELKQEDFLEILVTEVTNQDPLDPMDSDMFMENFMNMANFDATQNMADQFGIFFGQQQQALAAQMLGKTVTAVRNDLSEVTGEVEKARIDGDNVYLTINGEEFLSSNVQSIQQTITP